MTLVHKRFAKVRTKKSGPTRDEYALASTASILISLHFIICNSIAKLLSHETSYNDFVQYHIMIAPNSRLQDLWTIPQQINGQIRAHRLLQNQA
jgi:hypothetical protein